MILLAPSSNFVISCSISRPAPRQKKLPGRVPKKKPAQNRQEMIHGAEMRMQRFSCLGVWDVVSFCFRIVFFHCFCCFYCFCFVAFVALPGFCFCCFCFCCLCCFCICSKSIILIVIISLSYSHPYPHPYEQHQQEQQQQEVEQQRFCTELKDLGSLNDFKTWIIPWSQMIMLKPGNCFLFN